MPQRHTWVHGCQQLTAHVMPTPCGSCRCPWASRRLDCARMTGSRGGVLVLRKPRAGRRLRTATSATARCWLWSPSTAVRVEQTIAHAGPTVAQQGLLASREATATAAAAPPRAGRRRRLSRKCSLRLARRVTDALVESDAPAILAHGSSAT
jgi:hypothetical protein